LFELIFDQNQISKTEYDDFYKKHEILSKMLLGLINSQR